MPNGGRRFRFVAAGPGLRLGLSHDIAVFRQPVRPVAWAAASPAGARRMIDREKVLTVLRRRFAGATDRDLASAANAIVGLEDEWEDVTEREPDLLAHLAHTCGPECFVSAESHDMTEFRLLMRRSG